PYVRRSASLEHRWPLLDEGANALAGVFRLRGDVLREGLELERRAEIDVQTVIERPLREPDGDGRAGGDFPRQLIGGRHQLFRWMDGADDPEPERRLGIDDLAGEDQLARLGHADDARQEVRPAPVWMQAPLDERLGELRGRRGEANVAAEREVHPGARRGAVHRGDDGLGRVAHGEQDPTGQRRHLVDPRPLGATLLHVVHGLHVAARAESLASAGYHDHANVGIAAGAEHGVVEVVAQRAAQGVEALRPVERQRRDGVLHFVDQTLVVGHGPLLYKALNIPRRAHGLLRRRDHAARDAAPRDETDPRCRAAADHGGRHLRAERRHRQGWSFVVVRDAAKRARLGELYREAWGELMKVPYYAGAAKEPRESPAGKML